ncbi:hypothetical protein PCANC_09845 [Puccinia coronata f. sp. avenae]|uniref:DNA 3'-5' helicase n=1 Tax=Puccinia coronata f. sp. avenae TaxID=200324 RepID=A0A2N5T3X6_9BASI|nr:hypothetical protein PCANC_09845 [Puccinia coronata f. sp. avenae]
MPLPRANTGKNRCPHKSPHTGRTGISVAKKLLQSNDNQLKDKIATRAKEFYKGVEVKPLQIDVVANLACGRDTFLLAGTGFGKSRIAEIYHTLLPQRANGVVLVLNPLDALGNNQVEEKVGLFTEINLTKLTFNPFVANKIKHGAYNFVYLSPEIFMNNKLWDLVYFSAEFQDCLALVVVDEAHMIYIWGVVESSHGKSQSLQLLVRHEDNGTFRPYYGKIGLHLQCRNNAPLLLLLATCCPVAIEGIMKCLKLSTKTLDSRRTGAT